MNRTPAADGGLPVTLEDILLIEATGEILEVACPATGIAVWPQARIWFIRQIMADLLYANDGVPNVPTRPTPLRAATTLARSVLHNRRLLRSQEGRAEILVTTEAMADQRIDGRWYNRMADPFATAPGRRSLVLIDQQEWAWRWPRDNPHVYFHAPLQFASSLTARVSVSAAERRQAGQLAQMVAARARDLIGWDMGEERLRAFATYIGRKLATTAPRYRAYQKLLATVCPKAIVNSSGCYGHIATMMAAANDAGVVTAEYQHGAVSEGHDAYNFALALHSDPRLLRVLPRHFLSYGEWWNAHFNAPVRKTAIGYPDRAAKLARLGPPSAERRIILILSDGIETDLYLDLARTIAAAVRGDGLEVAFRPHPAERTQVLAHWREDPQGPRLDLASDIYKSFAKAHAVVSDMSTGLFEAVGLVENIVMLDSAKARFTYPDHPFAVASSPDAVLGLIGGGGAATLRIVADELWAPDWRANYERFLAREVDGHAG